MATLAVLRYPPLTRLLGHRFSASALPLLASLCSALAFLQPEPTWYGQAVHVAAGRIVGVSYIYIYTSFGFFWGKNVASFKRISGFDWSN